MKAYVMVRRVPTDEMVAAACQQMWQEYGYGDGDWHAMRAALEAALAAAPQAEPVADGRPTWNVPHAVTIRCLRAAEGRIRAGEAPADVFADYGWGFAPDGSATVPQWIECSDRMPEEAENVVVCGVEDPPAVAYWYADPKGIQWCVSLTDDDITDVTHWMPLPAAPRGQR